MKQSISKKNVKDLFKYFLLRKTDFLKILTFLVSALIFGNLQLTQVPLNFKTFCCNLKISGLGAKVCMAFCYFQFKRNYEFLKSKSPCFLLNKNMNFNKNEINLKMGNPIALQFKDTMKAYFCFRHTLFQTTTLGSLFHLF